MKYIFFGWLTIVALDYDGVNQTWGDASALASLVGLVVLLLYVGGNSETTYDEKTGTRTGGSIAGTIAIIAGICSIVYYALFT